MPFYQSNGIRYFSFASLRDQGFIHAIFSRQGGVSRAPWSALNVGGTVGDDQAHVKENIHRSFQALERTMGSQFDVWQVHGREVICAQEPRPAGQAHYKADAILTDRPEVTLFMRFADCVPILLADPVRRVAGVVHAGWQGTVKHVAAAAVEKMQACYGSRPQDLIAGIGPSIGPDHYEIGPEVAVQVRKAYPQDASRLLIQPNGWLYLDLWTANALSLRSAGVEQIEVSGICTACNLQDWYSHRGEKGKTGRFGALIALAN